MSSSVMRLPVNWRRDDVRCQRLTHKCRACGTAFPADDKRENCGCGEDRRCQKEAVTGYRFCSNHGGPAPARGFYGLGAPMTNGSGSSFPLTRLASKYVQMQRDGRVLSNRSSIEIVRTRIQQLAERIDMNDAPDRFATIQKLWEQYTEKLDLGFDLEAQRLRIELDAQFKKAGDDYAAWKQMFDALDLDRKMVESEVKVVKEIQAMLTAEDAYQLAAKLLGAVLDVETDPEKLKLIQYRFARIIGENPDRRAGSGSGDYIDAE